MIVAGIENMDSSFFSIESKDISDRIFSGDIMSFSYTEEVQRYNTGTLQVHDPDHYYSKVLRNGAKLDISFGYRAEDFSDNAKLLKLKNPNQLFGGNARIGIKAYIQNPSGKASSDGNVVFNCLFYGSEYLNTKQRRVHVGLTKGNLVIQLLSEIGCTNVEVNFTRQNEFLNSNTQIFQRETNYRLLLRFAREWRAIFRIGNDSKGNLTGIFISPQYIGSYNLTNLASGAFGGDSIFLEWKAGVNNVQEYSWKNHAGENGGGDNARIITGADGRPTIIRYVTSNDRVQAYRLNTDRIRQRLKKAGDFTKRAAELKEWLNSKTFAEVKWAFDPIELSTAPQGLGYSMQVKMRGVPLMSAPLKVLYGEGFPTWFTPQDPKKHFVNFYARKVTHTINQQGYTMDLDIADAFTVTGGSLI